MENSVNIGDTFNNYTVIGHARTNTGQKAWLCKCSCGNETIMKSTLLLKREIQGCLTCSIKKKKEISHKNYIVTTTNNMFRVYKSNAKIRNLEFKLTREEFDSIVLQCCFYCGKLPINGIDRKNSSVGYVLSNCLTCCTECNKAKSNRDYDNFINWVLKVSKNLQAHSSTAE